MTTNKRAFTARMSDLNYQKLKYIASKKKRSISSQIEYLVEKEIMLYEKENGPIKISESEMDV